MASQGYLVAAGPLPDEDGAGMTILRLPGAGQLAEATRLATEDDASVASGFFTVTVRPWQVMLTGSAWTTDPAGSPGTCPGAVPGTRVRGGSSGRGDEVRDQLG